MNLLGTECICPNPGHDVPSGVAYCGWKHTTPKEDVALAAITDDCSIVNIGPDQYGKFVS